MIPGLERAEFARYGSVHRNTFIDSPRLLRESLQVREERRLFFTGQITGVEGYMESTAIGLLAGINAVALSRGKDPVVPPPTTAMGALIHYLTHADTIPFQPMNVNFGLFPPLPGKVKARERKARLARRALEDLKEWKERCGI